MGTITYKGVDYVLPKAKILHLSPITQSEIGGRVCYDSFDKSPHKTIEDYTFESEAILEPIDSSDLLENLSHVLHHESVMEHTSVTFHLTRVSRGALQELARHRIASYSVRSTRYTMSELLVRGLAYYWTGNHDKFAEWIVKSKVLVVEGYMATSIAQCIANKLFAFIDHEGIMATKELILSKAQLVVINESGYNNERELIQKLLKAKSKRNVGDAFKFLVDDMWSTELVMTINMRSLKNFVKLRLSKAAWFLIQELAKDMMAQLPTGYKRLITKASDNV